MLRAFKAFDQLRGGDARPWLMRIVRNCWSDRRDRRHDVPLPVGGEGPELAYEGLDAEAQAIRASEGRRVRAMIANLPEVFREVLILREMEDLSYREIAEVTDTPIGTVMSRLARARALLKDQWVAEDQHGLR
jgi:RNA polymerase sigma-70 factor (ECF subfamily)